MGLVQPTENGQTRRLVIMRASGHWMSDVFEYGVSTVLV